MVDIETGAPYSATVKLSLHANDGRFRLSAIKPDGITLFRPSTIVAGPATVVMCIDGSETRWRIRLAGDVHPDDGVEIAVPLGECLPDDASCQAG